jgi:hypothetical protein
MHDGACLAYNTNSLGKPGDTANLHELGEIIDAISIKVWRFIARKQYALHACGNTPRRPVSRQLFENKQFIVMSKMQRGVHG